MTARDDTDRLWRGLRRVFRLPVSTARLDADIDEELRFHLDGRIEELMQREGLSRAAAEREARRRFGDVGHYRQEARAIDHTLHRQRSRMEFRDALGRELRLAARSLRRSPSFSLIAITTLALGIGAATAIFTLLDAVVLRPLPYPGADRLVSLSSPVPKLQGQTRWGLARHQMFYFLEHGRTLEALGVYNRSDATVHGAGPDEKAERVRAVNASASIFSVLGMAPLHGRLLVAEDNTHARPAVVVLGYDFWMRRFGGDPGVVGRTLNVEGLTLSIIGVLPRGASLPDQRVDIWAPAHVDSTVKQNNHTWSAIGRLAPGFTAADAQRELAPLTARLPEAFPTVYRATFVEATGFTTEVVPLRDQVIGEMVTRALWALFGAVGLVLLIASANIANLFLVRLDARRREVALRTALGANRSHLAWQYLAESMLIATIGGAVALAVAAVMLKVMLLVAPSDLPRVADVRLQGAGVLFGLGVALIAGLAFGLMPLLGWRFDLASLRDSGRGLTSSRRSMLARRTLVASQMAFAVVLLASAVLMVRTWLNLQAIQPGFDPRGVLTMELALPRAEYGRGGPAYDETAARTSALYERLAAQLRALPGVTHTAVSTSLPLLSGDLCNGITLQGATPDAARGACPPVAVVSPGYFEAMGIAVDGRTPDWAGMNAGDGAMVVSRAFAEHHWPNENPIGKGIRANGLEPPFYRVVGIADDVRGNGLDAPAIETVYFPVRPIPGAPLWQPPYHVNLVVRTSVSNPLELANAVTRLVQDAEPQATLANVQTLEHVVAQSIARRSFTMLLLGIAAAIAMLLSAVGIYGVISYIVTQRRGEIGVRMALGAQVRQVTGMVLGQSVGIAALGVAAGVVAALLTTRVLGALLYGVAPNDPLTLLVVPVLLLAVALIASYAPARRAARTNPVEALRSE